MNYESMIEIKPLDEEPYVLIEDGTALAGWDKNKEITYNQQMRQKAKVEFYRNAFEFLYAHKVKGDYFEFGCHKVRTFRMVLTEARKKNMHDMRFFAFDSFEGLPDVGDNLSQNPVYAAGGLQTSEAQFLEIIRAHNVYADKVRAIKGFYEQTLNDELKNRFKSEGIKTNLITLDCSLYESFVAAFDFIEDFLQEGSVIYIDDWRVLHKGSPEAGVPKAFKEFQKKSSFRFDPFLDVAWCGKSFIVYR